MKNILENAGIGITLKNEYAAGASGDLAPLDTWLELWLINDNEEAIATSIIKKALAHNDSASWVCHHCQETNPNSFDVCWHCQKEK